MNIEEVLKQREQINVQLKELDGELYEYYNPIINDMVFENDKKGLKELIEILPECYTKMNAHHALQKLR